MTTQITATRKIGRNKGKPRLWIEGKLLTDAGFAHGDRWDLLQTLDGNLLIVKALELEGLAPGKRKIAGKPGRPVIDIAASSLDPVMIDGEPPATVTLSYRPSFGLIVVGAAAVDLGATNLPTMEEAA